MYIAGNVNKSMRKDSEKRKLMRTEESEKRNSLIKTVILAALAALIMIAAISLFYVIQEKENLRVQFGEETGETQNALDQNEKISIYLPETYYAVTGQTVEIYNNQVTDQCSDITRYNVLWKCDIGESLERKYSLSATEEMVGEHELTLSIYDNALNLLAEKTCTLKVTDRKSEQLQVYEIRSAGQQFSAQELTGDAIRIFLEADNVRDGEQNAAAIIRMIEEIRAAGVELPVYVINAIYQTEPEQEAFYQMTALSEKLTGYENVYFLPVTIGLDSEYNLEGTMPGQEGYRQIADIIFAADCAIASSGSV